MRVTSEAEARTVMIGAHVAWIVPTGIVAAAAGIAMAGGSVYLAALVIAIQPIFAGVEKILEVNRRKHQPPES